jgi:hypothetical protein
LRIDVTDEPVILRARATVAASLAARSRDRQVAKLLLLVSEELEEEACKLDMKRGDPQLD